MNPKDNNNETYISSPSVIENNLDKDDKGNDSDATYELEGKKYDDKIQTLALVDEPKRNNNSFKTPSKKVNFRTNDKSSRTSLKSMIELSATKSEQPSVDVEVDVPVADELVKPQTKKRALRNKPTEVKVVESISSNKGNKKNKI